MTTRKLTISPHKLRLGMFVADLDRSWDGTPFPLQGILVSDPRQITYLRQLCREVVVDVDRSSADSVEHLPDMPLDSPDTHNGRRARRSVFGFNFSFGQWMRAWWERTMGSLFGGRSVKHQPVTRLAGMPADIELVAYQDTKTFEEAIGPAREAYREIEATMKMVMGNLAEKREISVEVLSIAATELVESVAINPEAMMWLTRMREQNVRTYEHSVQVAIYMITFGRHLGYPPANLQKLCMIGLLLDIGMTRVDNALLEKEGPLSESEEAEIRRHVEYSLEMLANSPDVDPEVREAIAEHHERIDGSGYPLGLKGHDTSFAGRMVAIADTFATLTSQRPYAEALSAFKSMKVLSEGAGTVFHEALVEQFVQAIGLFPVGSLVELSSGEVAAVVSHNKIRRLKPRVLVLTDVKKRPLDTPFELNLLLDPKDSNDDALRIWRGLPAGAYGVNGRDYFLK